MVEDKIAQQAMYVDRAEQHNQRTEILRAETINRSSTMEQYMSLRSLVDHLKSADPNRAELIQFMRSLQLTFSQLRSDIMELNDSTEGNAEDKKWAIFRFIQSVRNSHDGNFGSEGSVTKFVWAEISKLNAKMESDLARYKASVAIVKAHLLGSVPRYSTTQTVIGWIPATKINDPATGDDMEDLGSLIEKLAMLVKVMRNTCFEFADYASKKEGENISLQLRIRELGKERRELLNRLGKQSNEDVEEMRIKLNDAHLQMGAAKAAKKFSNQSRDQLKSNLEDLEAKMETLAQELSLSRMDVIIYKDKLTRNHQQLDDLQQTLDERNKAHKDDLRELKERNETLKQQKEDAERQNLQAVTRFVEQAGDRDREAIAMQDFLRKNISDLKEMKRALESENCTLKATVTDQNDKFDRAQADLDTSKADLKASEEQATTLKSMNKELNESIQTLKEEITILKEQDLAEKRELKETVEKLTKEVADLNDMADQAVEAVQEARASKAAMVALYTDTLTAVIS